MGGSPEGQGRVTGSHDKRARLWSLEDGSLLREFKGHTQFVDSVSMTPDGQRLVTGSSDGTARSWLLVE